MTRKRRTAFLMACGLLMLVGFSVILAEREPSYGGRRLSAWVSDIRPKIYFPWDWRVVTPRESTNARQAIREIGTNAVPYLTKWIAYRQPTWKTNVIWRANRIWEAFGVTNKFSDKQFEKANRAAEAFEEIRMFSDERLAEIGVLMSSRDADVSRRAAKVLQSVGGLSVGAAIILLSHRSAAVRQDAAMALGNRKDAHLAIPALIRALNDASNGVVVWTAIRLGDIRSDPKLVLPALTNSLRHKSPEVRSAAACAIARFGREALGVMPALVGAQQDPDSSVRTNVHLALALIERHTRENP